MVDYKLKQKVLQLDEQTSILKLENQYNKLLFYIGKYGYVPAGLNESYLNYTHRSFEENVNSAMLFEVEKINNSTYQRCRRLRMKINWMLSNFRCSFLTFNFNNYALSLDASYRRILVQRTLNALNCHYIANIDFGSSDAYLDDNGVERVGTSREHYHAIVATVCDSRSTPCLVNYCKTYGHVYVVPCRMTSSDVRCLATYTAKLANHAIKETAQRSALLFSRKFVFPSENELQDIELPRLQPVDTTDFLFETSEKVPHGIFDFQEDFLNLLYLTSYD